MPPLRASPFEPDSEDSARADFLRSLWTSWDPIYRGRDKQVEENLRILAGQQWIVWSELRQRWIDVTRFMTDEERRWRHLPVLNRVFMWHMLTHARLTENPPVLSFQAGPDRIDSELAEVMDAIFKWQWNETDMTGTLDEAMAWIIPGGEVGLKSLIDPHAGDPEEYRGDAVLSLLDAAGNPAMRDGQPIQRFIEGAPFGPDGQVLGQLVPDPDNPSDFAFQPTDDPYTARTGAIRVDVLPCFDYRGEPGQRQWHRKRIHIHRALLTPQQFYDKYGVEEEPDTGGSHFNEAGNLFGMVFGGGSWGGATGRTSGLTLSEPQGGYITVYEGWFAPGRGTEETPESPGGRLLSCTGSGRVIRDGARPARFKHTSPIRVIGFVNLPGRASFSTPQEMLNGMQRTRNRMDAQVMDYATRAANPIQLIDQDSGLQEGQVSNLPSQQIYVSMSQYQGQRLPIAYVDPPELNETIWRTRATLTTEFDDIANIPGSSGAPPTADASGELVKELRFNADRFVGPTARRGVVEMGRLALDWQALLTLVYSEEKLIRIAGEDNIGRTFLLMPEVLKVGNVHVQPELESMLPEGRGERQGKVEKLWLSGAFGDPVSFDARTAYLEASRFPHLGRASRPGGSDRPTAEQNVGKLLQGTPALGIPVFEWYDHAVHLWVIERFMKSPEYLKVDGQTQLQMVLFRQVLQMAQADALARQAQVQALTQAGAAMAAAQGVSAMTGPDPAALLADEAGGNAPPARRSA